MAVGGQPGRFGAIEKPGGVPRLNPTDGAAAKYESGLAREAVGQSRLIFDWPTAIAA